MTLVDTMNVPTISDPQLYPDWHQIVFVKAEPNWKLNRRISHLWKVNADGTGLLQMTSSPDGENDPRWSPDGKTIAFLTKRGEAEGNQIYLISTLGGEARALTNHGSAVSNINWSPDGTMLYFPRTKKRKRNSRKPARSSKTMFSCSMKTTNRCICGPSRSQANRRIA